MNDSSWVTTKYPELYKSVLVYDAQRGYNIAYYDNVMNLFYSKETNIPLIFVKAWQELPKEPVIIHTLKQSITTQYIPRVQTTDKSHEDRKDNI